METTDLILLIIPASSIVGIYVYLRIEIAKLNVRVAELERRQDGDDSRVEKLFTMISDLKDSYNANFNSLKDFINEKLK